MEIKVIKSRSNPEFNRINLDVSYDHMKRQVFVRSGEFRIGKVDFILSEDEIINIPDSGIDTVIQISLVQLPSSEVRVMYDKISADDPVFDYEANSITVFATLAILKYVDNTYTVPEITLYKVDKFLDESVSEIDQETGSS